MKTKKQWWLVIGIICINILIVGFSAAIAAEAPPTVLPMEELPEETAEITALREKLEVYIDEYMPIMIEMSDHLYNNPESGYFEFESSKYVTAELEKNGFEITWGVEGLDEEYNSVIEKLFNARNLPTAFTAKYKGKSEYPVIAFTTEMDALRGDPPFHGCAHNQQPPVALGAAIAMSKIMDEYELPGSIWVIHLTAEEIPPPDPTAMFKAGYFDEVDFVLQTHGGVNSGVLKRPLAGTGGSTLISANLYEFYGKTAHAAGDPWNGNDAGDAVRAMWSMIDMLREHSEPGYRFHGALIETAQAPNVINPFVRFDHWVRASAPLTQADIDKKVEQVDTIAKAAAMGTFCDVEISHYADYGYGCTTAWAQALGWYYTKMYSDEGMTSEELGRLAPGWDVGQTVSWSIPGLGSEMGTATIAMADVPPTAGHSQEKADLTTTPLGHRSLGLMAKRQGAVALRLVTQPELLENIKKELADWREYGVEQGYVTEDMFRIKDK
ncbi:MAG: M20 family metallopeptidase [Candidatus Atribacteria bacterium]|nr:M20 family metallopeptidase [Candidatus Atribacteria bacterium]